mgnify:CR=1 FL=1
MGQLLVDSLKQNLAGHSLIKDIRGCGMMIGIELTIPCAVIVDIALEKKLLVNVTADKVIRLLPPLISSKEEIAMITNLISASIEDFQQQL